MTVPEGLEDSGRPCAEVLSVSGFFAQMGRFLLGKRFILRVKVVPFLRGKAGTVDAGVKSATSPLEECNGERVRPGTHRLGTVGRRIYGHIRQSIPGWEAYRGGHIPLFSLFWEAKTGHSPPSPCSGKLKQALSPLFSLFWEGKTGPFSPFPPCSERLEWALFPPFSLVWEARMDPFHHFLPVLGGWEALFSPLSPCSGRLGEALS